MRSDRELAEQLRGVFSHAGVLYDSRSLASPADYREFLRQLVEVSGGGDSGLLAFSYVLLDPADARVELQSWVNTELGQRTLLYPEQIRAQAGVASVDRTTGFIDRQVYGELSSETSLLVGDPHDWIFHLPSFRNERFRDAFDRQMAVSRRLRVSGHHRELVQLLEGSVRAHTHEDFSFFVGDELFVQGNVPLNSLLGLKSGETASESRNYFIEPYLSRGDPVRELLALGQARRLSRQQVNTLEALGAEYRALQKVHQALLLRAFNQTVETWPMADTLRIRAFFLAAHEEFQRLPPIERAQLRRLQDLKLSLWESLLQAVEALARE